MSARILGDEIMKMFNGRARACTILFPLLIILPGCSTIELGDVGKLAQAGQTSSANLATYYGNAGSSLPAVLEIEVLRSTLQPGISPPSSGMIQSVKRVQTSFSERTRLSGDLASLYDALYELAATDYPGGFVTASKDFYGSIGQFAAAIGEASPITEAQTKLLDNLAGKLIAEQQKRRAGQANLIILQQLEQLQPLLASDRQVVTEIRQATARQVEEGGIALWRAGLVSAKPLLSRYGGVAGLEMVSTEASFTVANPKLAQTVPALIRFRLGQIEDAEARKYAALEELVEDLIRRHREVANGAPIDVASLLAKTAELRSLRDDFTAAVKP